MKTKKSKKVYWLLLLIPYLWDVFLIPSVNQVKVHPFGIPFLLFWMLLGVVLVTVVLAIVYHFDVKNEQLEKDNL